MSTAYLALDLETTGLDPFGDQILEIGAVYDDPELPLMSCPTFELIVDPSKDDGEIRGSAYALQMNQRLLEYIALNDCPSVEEGVARLMDWVVGLRLLEGIYKFHLLGKNVGSFDAMFLGRVASWRKEFFHYRSLDVGSMYADREGMSGQADLIKRIETMYLIPGDEHTALHDARVSLALARSKWGC